MASTVVPEESTVADHRNLCARGVAQARERRQFFPSSCELSPDAVELAWAIDRYKLSHRRRLINFEELLAIVISLGYHR